MVIVTVAEGIFLTGWKVAVTILVWITVTIFSMTGAVFVGFGVAVDVLLGTGVSLSAGSAVCSTVGGGVKSKPYFSDCKVDKTSSAFESDGFKASAVRMWDRIFCK